MDKIRAFWAKLNADPSSLWEDSKAFVIIFGAIILFLKFKDVAVNFLVSGAQAIYNNASQKANNLNNQENQANEDANQLIDDANKLPNNQPPVDDGWNLKKIVVFFLLMSISTEAFGGCDWSSIKKNTDGTYTYSHELFLCNGKLVQDNATKDKQIQDLTKAITMKDLSIQKANDQVKLWNDTASSLEGRLQKIDRLDRDSDVLYFAGGILTAVLVGFSIAKLAGK